MTPEDMFESVAEALSKQGAAIRAKMFGSPGLKVGNKVFACLVEGKLVVKLPKERVDALVKSGKGEHFDPGMGRLMKEWAAVRPTTPDEWLRLAAEAKEFVTSAMR